MAQLRCDEHGFLVGEAVGLDQVVDQLARLADDVAAIRSALSSMGQARAETQASEQAQPVPDAPHPDVRVDVEVDVDVQAETRADVNLPNAGRNDSNPPQPPLPPTARAERRRDSRGRFERDGNPPDTGNPDAERQRENKRFKDLGDRIVQSNIDTQNVDPVLDAFNEVARPLGRGFGMLGRGDEKQEGWLKKIWRALIAPRPDGQGGNQGGGLLGGAGAAAAGALKLLAKKLPLIAAVVGGIGALFGLSDVENDPNLSQREKDEKSGGIVGGFGGMVAGMLAGGSAGATLGAAGGPIGIAIGGLVGGAVGAFLGENAGQIIGTAVGGWVNDLRGADIPAMLSNAWNGALSAITGFFAGIPAALLGAWDKVTAAIGAGFQALFGEQIAAIQKAASETLDKAKSLAQGVAESVKQGAEAANTFIKDKTGVDIDAMVTQGVEQVSRGMDVAAQGVEAVKEAAKEKLEEVVKGAESLWEQTKEGAVQAGTTIVNVAAPVVQKGVEVAQQTAEKVGEVAANTTTGKLVTGGAKVVGAAMSEAGQGISQQWKAVTGELDAEMVAKFQEKGWTKEQAAGIVANLKQESGSTFNHQAVGDRGKAYGIAQWHPDRQADFKAWAGKDIRESTRDEQIAFVDYELRQGKEKAAGDKLRQATTAGEAGAIVSRHYERPMRKDEEAANRSASAEKIAAKVKTEAIAGESQLPPSVAALPVKGNDGSVKTLEQMGVKSWDDLQARGGQAFAGGRNDPATLYATSLIAQDMGENFGRVTAQNDYWHAKNKPNSEHTQGNKTDFTVQGMSYADAHQRTAETMQKHGLEDGKDFKIISTPHGTGNHIDFKLTESGQAKMNAKMQAEAKAAESTQVAQAETKAKGESFNAQFGQQARQGAASNDPARHVAGTAETQIPAQLKAAAMPAVSVSVPNVSPQVNNPPSVINPAATSLGAAPAINEPLTTASANGWGGRGGELVTPLAGQDVRDRRIAHIQTGGISNSA